MFCITRLQDGRWVAEHVILGKSKLTAYGVGPEEAIDKLFNMIKKDDDEPESAGSTEGNGEVTDLAISVKQPPNCS